jgi:hypothetical protein
MISNQSRTKEWIMQTRKIAAGKDPILIEKMIMALTLVENLRLSGLVVCWINNARNSWLGLSERGKVGHLLKKGDEPCVVESPKNSS